MNGLTLPPWLRAPIPRISNPEAVEAALTFEAPGEEELAALLSPAAQPFLEPMASRAQALTTHHFGRTLSLYIPLYLSDYCSNGCAYCGFASDRKQVRSRLSLEEIEQELDAIRELGLEEILLLTGERSSQADFSYLLEAVRKAASCFPTVSVECFPMSVKEYAQLAEAGCVGVTLYQETYHPGTYDQMHRWGPKRDYLNRLEAPERALQAGLRTLGLGVLLGLHDPLEDVIALFRHAQYLRRSYWRSGITLSFPRICAQAGGFQPAHPVSEAYLAQIVFALRLLLPDVPLVLSTRERAQLRDGLAGLGINKMSVASRTQVGGYQLDDPDREGQFHIQDSRDVSTFCQALRHNGLEPVFKNWDAAYR